MALAEADATSLSRTYYNSRTGHRREVRHTREVLNRLIADQLTALRSSGWLQQAFGYWCTDRKTVAGSMGTSLELHLLTRANIDVQEPVEAHLSELSDADLFTVLEVVADIVAKPVSGTHHKWDSCGYHADDFAPAARSRAEYIERIDPILRDYGDGFTMTADGEVQLLLTEPAVAVCKEPLPLSTPPPVRERVESAVRRFLKGGSSWDERHAAVRDLGDALEHMRDGVREVLVGRDESDLFQLLNGFGIRHLNDSQRLDYDREIFLKWMFYYLTAALHACLALLDRQAGEVAS